MMNNLSSLFKLGAVALLLISAGAQATGMVPDTSVVLVDEADGEGGINVKNTDSWPALLVTTLENIPGDNEDLLTVTPPAARVEPGKSQRVRFILTSKEPLKTERLKRVIFEGIPPQEKGKSEVRMTIRQNLPVIIHPAGLAKIDAPWEKLSWKIVGSNLTVNNPSPYVIRLSQTVQTLPAQANWILPASFILPGQTLTLEKGKAGAIGDAKQVRIFPATTWGYAVKSYDAALAQ